jgi:hypothetical protein
MQRTRSAHLLVAAITAVILLSQGSPAAAGGRTEDPWGFSFAAPAGWQGGDKSKFSVPGELHHALVPADAPTGTGASITIFLQKPGKEFNARQLLDISVAGMKKSGAEPKVAAVRPVAAMTAMWMEVVGPGTGAAFKPGGPTRTTQIWVAVPRGNDVLVLLLTSAEASVAGPRAAFEGLVKSLTFNGAQTPGQKSAK